MPRCSTCTRAVKLKKRKNLERGTARVWASYEQLLAKSASCDFCALCHQYLHSWCTRKTLEDAPGRIELYVREDRIELSSPALGGKALILQFEELHGGSESRPPPYVRGYLDCALEWLDRCASQHRSVCWGPPLLMDDGANDSVLPGLPRRLVDLREHDVVRVIDCKDWVEAGLLNKEELGLYFTLSYRWGDTDSSYALRKPFNTVLELPLDSMPRTIMDAFAVVRALGGRFIWIDALCIVQGTPEDDTDFLAEGRRMGSIYHNSLCTIAATCALHAHEGFLARTGSGVYNARPCTVPRTRTDDGGIEVRDQVRVLPSTPNFFTSVSSSTLNSRGWVMQERALSRRILHFTEHGVFWECCVLKALDHAGDLEIETGVGACRRNEALMNVARSRRTRHLCPVEWFHFIAAYSEAQFTRPSDRLVALSSVARAVEPLVESEYLKTLAQVGREPVMEPEYFAGLWGGDFIRGLNWFCQRSKTNKAPESKDRCFPAPTWSWASVESGVCFATLTMDDFYIPLLKVLDVSIEPSPGMNRYEGIARGTLRVRGTLHHLVLPTSPRPEYNHDLIVHWDELQEEHEGERDYTLLPIQGKASSYPTFLKPPRFSAMILEPLGPTRENRDGVTESVSGRYRRIGWTAFHFPDVKSRYTWMRMMQLRREGKKATEAFREEVPLQDAIEKWPEYEPVEIEVI